MGDSELPLLPWGTLTHRTPNLFSDSANGWPVLTSKSKCSCCALCKAQPGKSCKAWSFNPGTGHCRLFHARSVKLDDSAASIAVGWISAVCEWCLQPLHVLHLPHWFSHLRAS